MWNNIKISVILGIFSLYLAVGSCHWQDVSKHPNLYLLPNDICGPVYSGTYNLNDEPPFTEEHFDLEMHRKYAMNGEAAFHELPWMAVIHRDNEKHPLTYESGVCGGTVINERYVLTAANCIKPDTEYNVKLGTRVVEGYVDCFYVFEYNKWKKLCAPKPQKIAVEQTIIHPNFSASNNDIALLRLSRKADLSTGAVKPICLPIAVSQQKANMTGRTAETAGWGKRNKDQKQLYPLLLKPPVIIQECDLDENLLIDHPICAVLNTSEYGCRKDSGGPLSLEEYGQDGNKTVQYGIAKDDSVCGSAGPRMYTRVGYYIKWILDNIKP